MYLLNTVFLLVGIFVLAIGILAFFNPAFARWINAPGGTKLKAMIAIIIGLFFILLSLLVQMPLEGT